MIFEKSLDASWAEKECPALRLEHCLAPWRPTFKTLDFHLTENAMYLNMRGARLLKIVYIDVIVFVFFLQLSFDLIEEWISKNPEASICTREGVKAFRDIAIFQDYHGLPEFRNVRQGLFDMS